MSADDIAFLVSADDKTSIKDTALKELDAELGGVLSEFVDIDKFAGKSVRLHRQPHSETSYTLSSQTLHVLR